MTRLSLRRLLVVAVLASSALHGARGAAPAAQEDLATFVARLESEMRGRIGVAVNQPETGWSFAYRQDERFPMASTFKPLLCAGVLAQVARGDSSLDKVIRYEADEIVSWSPLTEDAREITLGDACAAALSHSDNTAANVALGSLGGPQGLTDYLRSIGDATTRLDRWETDLNEARPGDPRDTTTPRAMLASLEKVTLGKTLSESSRAQLLAWMAKNSVSDALIRSVLPDGWTVADRSGAGGYGTRNITAVLHDARGRSLVVVIFLTQTESIAAERNRAVARLAERLIAAAPAR
ncbi:MAG: class A beta-lactamase [Acidobacteriota bacterium]